VPTFHRAERSSRVAQKFFLDAEAECQKSLLKHAGVRRDPSGNFAIEDARRNALFGVLPENHGLQGLDGGRTRARTWDLMIKSLKLTKKFPRLSCK